MGPAFVMFGWFFIASLVFLPAFIIALVMLRSARRGLVLAATFTAGAFMGFLGCAVLGSWLMGVHPQELRSFTLFLVFATAGAIGGGVLAVGVLGHFSKYPPWRRC